MVFIYNTWLSAFWQDFVESIKCYDTGEDALVFVGGTIVHSNIEDLKKRHNYSGKTIAYQTEPLLNNHWWKPEQIINNLRGADEVWDYDLDNIEVLKSHGIDAKFKPPRYSQNLNRITTKDDPEIAVLFYGTMTEYRAKFLYDMLHGAVIPNQHMNTVLDLNVVTLWNVSGAKLDEYIANSKIIININPYDGESRQQQPRISYALNNNKCVISQKSNRNYFGDMITEFIDVHECMAITLQKLSDGSWRNSVIEKYKEQVT